MPYPATMTRTRRTIAALTTAVTLATGGILTATATPAAANACPANAFCLWPRLNYTGSRAVFYPGFSGPFTGDDSFINNTSVSAINNTGDDVLIWDNPRPGVGPWSYFGPGVLRPNIGPTWSRRIASIAVEQ